MRDQAGSNGTPGPGSPPARSEPNPDIKIRSFAIHPVIRDEVYRHCMTRTVVDLVFGEEAELAHVSAAPDLATRLMEHGFVPGAMVRALHSAPGGDPRVFRVDGAEIALRLETARSLVVRGAP